MKIGYPTYNTEIGCTPNRTMRLKSYSDSKLIELVSLNLECLQRTLEWNFKHNLLFFRIGSGIIPFASHNVNSFDWMNYFSNEMSKIGSYILEHQIRISMHPDQFVVLSSPNHMVNVNSAGELIYHAQVLEGFGLDLTAKIQIHLGGGYGNKLETIKLFKKNYANLPKMVRDRIVLEHDDKIYSLSDCLSVYPELGTPIVFDNLHHACLNNEELFEDAFDKAMKTWNSIDGIPIVDYSEQSQLDLARKGSHAANLSTREFRKFLTLTRPHDFDIMLELKNKQISALKAVNIFNEIKLKLR